MWLLVLIYDVCFFFIGFGLENGLLWNFKGEFFVEIKGVGFGIFKIRIYGFWGVFKVEMYWDMLKECFIGVWYNLMEVGCYMINIKWVD